MKICLEFILDDVWAVLGSGSWGKSWAFQKRIFIHNEAERHEEKP
jgi:hypothetical protein